MRLCRLASLGRDRSGNFATMFALAAPLFLMLGAVAVDEASLYSERREAQALTDLAAIVAAANIDDAEDAVRTTFRNNGFDDIVIEGEAEGELINVGSEGPRAKVTLGRYVGSAETSPEMRFTPLAEPPNAVKVTFRKKGTRYFATTLMSAPTIGTMAVASSPTEAAFSIGSRLLRIDGGLLNKLLGALIGGNVSLDVMDYEALVDADISVLSFIDALATELDLTAATYDDVLQADAGVGDIASAIAAIPGLSHQAKLAVEALGGSASSAPTVPLSSLIDLGSVGALSLGQRPSGLDATVKVMELLTAGAALANGEDQVHVDLGTGIPGLVGATLDLAIGEPPQHSPWFRIGEVGTVVRTAQTRALITLSVSAGGLLGASVNLPVYAEIAYAEAQLTDISCSRGNPASTRVRIAARPGVALLRIAKVDATTLSNFSASPVATPAKLVNAPPITVTGQASVSITNGASTQLTFTHNDIHDGVVKTVSTRDITQSLTSSLLGNLSVTVSIAGLNLNLGLPALVETLLRTTLSGVTAVVDDILYSLLTTLGIGVGQADVRVEAASCGRSVLVQ